MWNGYFHFSVVKVTLYTNIKPGITKGKLCGKHFLLMMSSCGNAFENVAYHTQPYFCGSVQDCSISSALAMEILQFCTKPSICLGPIVFRNFHENRKHVEPLAWNAEVLTFSSLNQNVRHYRNISSNQNCDCWVNVCWIWLFLWSFITILA